MSLRQTEWDHGAYHWVLSEPQSGHYILICGDLFHLGFSSRIELVRALWNMPQLFSYPLDDIPDFVEVCWNWIEYDE